MKLKRDALKIRKPSGLKRIETAVYRNFILPRSRYSKSLLGLQKLFRPVKYEAINFFIVLINEPLL